MQNLAMFVSETDVRQVCSHNKVKTQYIVLFWNECVTVCECEYDMVM